MAAGQNTSWETAEICVGLSHTTVDIMGLRNAVKFWI